MEEKKTIFDYLAQIMMVFGFFMAVMNVFCLVFGETAKGFAAIFELGNQGIPVKAAFEFLGLSVLITALRFIFFTDTVIKKMPVWARTVCMLVSVVIIIAFFIIIFGWFPVGMWQPWAMFFACFAISFIGSCFVVTVKEKAENRKMEEALKRLKERGQIKNE